MEHDDYICLRCEHFVEHKGMGCRAYPKGIPYGYPPNNEHKTILKGQVGKYMFKPTKKRDKKY